MNSASTNRNGNRKNFRMKRSAMLAIAGATAGFALIHSVSGQTYTPIPLNSNSYNADVIVESTAPQTGATANITASMDSGTSNLNNNVWFEKGYYTTNTAYGLPTHGSTFTSIAGTNHVFTMPASYGSSAGNVNDALFIGATTGGSTTTTPSATFNFSTPQAFSALSFLTSTSGGAQTFTATLNYVNGNTQTITGLTSPDWFSPTGYTIAYDTFGRCVPSPTAASTFNSGPNGIGTAGAYLYQADATGITDITDPISSVTVTTAATGARISMFGISGDSTLVYTGTDPNFPGVFNASSTVQNFSVNGTAASFNTGNAVVFNDTASSAPNGGNVNIASGSVSPFPILFQNNAITYNLTGGAITGAGALIVSGGGTVNLNQLNTYTGQTNISNGILNASGGSIGTGGLVIGTTGTLYLGAANQVVSSLNGSGFISLSGSNLNIGTGSVSSTVISGTGNITFVGTQTLSSSNTYVGSTNLSGVTMTISTPTVFGASTNTVLVSGGATTSTLTPTVPFTVAGSNPLAYNFNIASGSRLAVSGTNEVDLTGTITLLGNASQGVATAGGLVSDVGPVIGAYQFAKTGAGTLQLNNTGDNFTSFNISAGIVQFASGTLGATNSPIQLSGGTLVYLPGNTEDITSTHVLNLNNGGGTINTSTNSITFANPINGTNLAQLVLIGPAINPGSLTILNSIKPLNANFSGGSPATPYFINFNGPTASYTQTSTTLGLNIGQNTGDYVIFNVSNGATFSILGGDANGGLNLADQANATSTDGANSATGVINIIGSTSAFNSTSELFIGKAGGNAATNVASGTINLFSGTLNAPSATLVTQLGSATNGYGFLNVTGGAAYLNLIQLGTSTNSFGTLNLSGGTLSASNISGGAGTSKVYFNGGILNANQNYSSAKSFISTLNSAQIQTGGLTITTFNVSSTTTAIQTNSSLVISANLSSGVTGGNDGGLTFNSGTGNLTLSGNDSYTGPTNLNGSLTFNQSGTSTLLGNITSVGTLTQSGTGATILGGTDSFPNGVYITSGVLQLQPGATLGATAINLSGGAIGIGSDSALAGYTVNNSGGAIQFDNYTSNLSFSNYTNLRLGAANGSASTLAGNIQGATNFTYIGPGTLILTGTNTYVGYTNISGGILNFMNGGLSTGAVSLTGGTLQYATGNTQDLTLTGLNINAGGGGIDTNGNNVTFSGNVASGSSAGAFTKYGLGTLTLDGSMAPGGVHVSGGNLSLVGTGANVSSTAFVSIGYAPGDIGTLTLDQGAKLSTNAGFNIADQGSTTTVNTGIVNVADTTNQGTTVTAVNIYVGKGATGNVAANSVGTINQTGGTVQVNASTGVVDVGYYGIGTYNQSGGNVIAGPVNIGVFNGSTGTYHLNGGTLTTSQIAGGAGTSNFAFNGGTVVANASSSTFVTGLTTASIGSGGFNLNSNGFTLTVPQNFSSGVTSRQLTADSPSWARAPLHYLEQAALPVRLWSKLELWRPAAPMHWARARSRSPAVRRSQFQILPLSHRTDPSHSPEAPCRSACCRPPLRPGSPLFRWPTQTTQAALSRRSLQPP